MERSRVPLALTALLVACGTSGGAGDAGPDAGAVDAASSDTMEMDPCIGITCGGHGRCAVLGAEAVCVCDPGFELVGMTDCQSDGSDPCAGVFCSGAGSCEVSDSEPVCNCDAGFSAQGLACLPDGLPTGCACSLSSSVQLMDRSAESCGQLFHAASDGEGFVVLASPSTTCAAGNTAALQSFDSTGMPRSELVTLTDWESVGPDVSPPTGIVRVAPDRYLVFHALGPRDLPHLEWW